MATESQRIERLPKWAQNLITKLDSDLRSVKKTLDEVATPADSETSVTWDALGTPRALPRRTIIRLRLNRSRPADYVEVSIREDSIGRSFADIRTGCTEMHVAPRAANLIHVYLGER